MGGAEADVGPSPTPTPLTSAGLPSVANPPGLAALRWQPPQSVSGHPCLSVSLRAGQDNQGHPRTLTQLSVSANSVHRDKSLRSRPLSYFPPEDWDPCRPHSPGEQSSPGTCCLGDDEPGLPPTALS